MALESFISGAWRRAGRGEVLIGGAWRRIVRAEVSRSGVWRQLFAFVSPISVTANNVSGFAMSRQIVQVTSDASQARPAGGLAPYSYSWAMLSGSATPATPNMAATTFSARIGPGQQFESTARVTCVDALGASATADIVITLENLGLD